jgi:hypothetical protein
MSYLGRPYRPRRSGHHRFLIAGVERLENRLTPSSLPAGHILVPIRPAHPTNSIRLASINGHGWNTTRTTVPIVHRPQVLDHHARAGAFQRGRNTSLLRETTGFAVIKPVQRTLGALPAARRSNALGRSVTRGRNATVSLSRVGAAITPVRISATGAGRVSRRRVGSAAADALLQRAGAGATTTAVKRAASSARSIRSDTITAVDKQVVRRRESIPQIAQLRPDWRPPLQPWTDWEPTADRFPVPLARSVRSSGPGTFESSGLPSPGRRSDGSAEKRKVRTASI